MLMKQALKLAGRLFGCTLLPMKSELCFTTNQEEFTTSRPEGRTKKKSRNFYSFKDLELLTHEITVEQQPTLLLLQ